jgi:transposase
VEAPVIGLETRVLLRHYLAEGMSHSALARQFGLSRRTLRRWVAAGELDRDLDADPPRYTPRPPVPARLDAFRPLIRERLGVFPELSAVRILEEIQLAGYSGGYSQLRDYVRRIRPRPPVEPVIRFETDPGHQGQVDFAEFRFPWGKRFALLVVLGYSRLLWLRFYERQDMRTLVTGLEAAFAYFGGVPRELLFDQMRSVITRDLRVVGGQLIRNEEFLRFSSHWDFTPRACRAYRAQTKGKVERPIRYVRGNFVYARSFLNDGDLNEQCTRWTEKANARVHGTTKEVPRLRYEQDERHLLRPLAVRPYHSLIALPAVERSERTPPIRLPSITVQRRPLASYAALAAGVR